MSDYYYPSRHDIKQAASNDFIPANFLRKFAQSQGIYLFHSNQESMSDYISGLFLGYHDLENIRRKAFESSPERTLSTFKYINEESDSEDSITPIEVIDKIIANGGELQLKSGVKVNIPNNINISDDGKKIDLKISYTKNKKGRTKFLQKEKREFEVTIKEESVSTFEVTVDCTASRDSKIMEEIIKTQIPKKGRVEKIMIDKLRSSETISFFDRLRDEAMGEDWNFLEISKLFLKKPPQTPMSEDEEEEVQDQQLIGISKALLEGQNLRNNEFVVSCERSNYRFTAMNFKYEHNDELHMIEVSAEFKGSPKVFEIAIKEYKKQEAKTTPVNENLEEPEDRMTIKKRVLDGAEKIYREIISER